MEINNNHPFGSIFIMWVISLNDNAHERSEMWKKKNKHALYEFNNSINQRNDNSTT